MTSLELKALTDVPFDFVLEDDEGNVMLAVPLPPEYMEGQSYSMKPGGGISMSEEDFYLWQDAWEKYEADLLEGVEAARKRNRSRKAARQAGAMTVKDMPDYIANITLSPYEQSMTPNENDTAYLQPILPHLVEQLRLQDDSINLDGMRPMRYSMGEDYYYDRSPAALKDLDLITLRAIQTIILKDVMNKAKTPRQIMKLVTDQGYINKMTVIYLPDFLRMIGYRSNINAMAMEYAIAKIKSYYRLDGLIKEVWGGRTYMSRYTVLNLDHYDDKTGTLHFYSPYLNKLIAMILSESMKVDEETKIPRTARNGEALLNPSFTKTINKTIGDEKNKRAAEIVFIIDALITKTGNAGVPHISAGNLIDRCKELKNALEAASSTSDKNKLLRRVFTKAWELLETRTTLKEKYRNIRFEVGIPKMSTLDMVFKFPHEGRIKEGDEAEAG